MEASFLGADTGDLTGKHFNTSHFEKAGMVLFEALIIYSGINIRQKLKEYHLPEFQEEQKNYEKFNMKDLIKELTSKKEIYDAMNDGDSSDGSDSAPSEDNLSDNEMSKILPVQIKKDLKKNKNVLEALRKRKEEKQKEIDALKEKEKSMQKP